MKETLLKLASEAAGREISLDFSVESLGLDSLEYVDFLLSIESSLGVRIPPEEAAKMERINDVAAYIEGKAHA